MSAEQTVGRHADPMRPVVAAFDVDGTLTDRDCVVPFLTSTAGTSRLVARLLRRPVPLLSAAARRDRDRLKQLGAEAAFGGIPIVELDRAGRRFGDRVADGWVRSDTAARLRWHRSEGHAVVLVSASFEVYLRSLGERLGVDAVLGTRLEVDHRGTCTGRLDGANCRGAEKVRRLHDWLRHHHGGRERVELWAYGDSSGDRAMLDDADHPVWARSKLSSVSATS